MGGSSVQEIDLLQQGLCSDVFGGCVLAMNQHAVTGSVERVDDHRSVTFRSIEVGNRQVSILC